MKPSFILGMIAGYVLGSRAGRERYEAIVAGARRVAGSQTVQATAGVLQAQVHELTGRAKGRASRAASAKLSSVLPPSVAANGHGRR